MTSPLGPSPCQGEGLGRGMKNNIKTFVLLHNIRSSHNVGSIFRTADAGGVEKIFISGYTPNPIDKFGRINKEIAKTALGGELSVAWEYSKNPMSTINKLKKSGVKIIGLEQNKKSVDYKKVKINKSSLIILGNEVTGVSKSLLKKCDEIVEIKMAGEKESLNVAVAFGIALFRMRNI